MINLSTAPGEAFEVPLDDPDSIIKKHPPKRLQRLVDAPSTETTIEELEEKLANAEIRRNQVSIFIPQRKSEIFLEICIIKKNIFSS